MSLPMEHRHDNIVYIVCILSGTLSGGSQISMLNWLNIEVMIINMLVLMYSRCCWWIWIILKFKLQFITYITCSFNNASCVVWVESINVGGMCLNNIAFSLNNTISVPQSDFPLGVYAL